MSQSIKVRVRGIYSTALTKLLLKSQFKVAQPSTMQEERFGVKENLDSYDLDVFDRLDQQGIHARGRLKLLTNFTLCWEVNFQM